MRVKIFFTGLIAAFLLLFASTAAAGVVNNVFPNGSDDTVNIENAFLSCVSSGPNCAVKLAAGTFYISRPIVVANFDGTFRGKGKHRTIIENLHDVPFPLMTTGPDAGLASMFFFYRDAGTPPSSLRFSDFSIRAIGEGEIWSSHDPSNQLNARDAIRVQGAVNGLEDFDVSSVDVFMEDVSITGEMGAYSPGGFNLIGGVSVWGEQVSERIDGTFYFKYTKRLTGRFRVKDSDFTNIFAPIELAGLDDSTVIIGGKPRDGNSFQNVGFAVWLIDLSNSRANISFNTGNDVINYGVWLENAADAVFGLDFGPIPELFPEPSTFSVHHNTFHLVDFADGIGLSDYGALVGLDATLNAVVAGNRLTLDSLYGGIRGVGTQNAVVLGNRIDGTGLAGIYFGFLGDPSSHWIIAGNRVDELEADVAPIWLGPDTSENLVITRNPDENVLDEGTDNVIIGR